MIDVRYVNDVKKSIGADAVEALTVLFKLATGLPPSVSVARFRADHPQWFDTLDSLEINSSLIKRTDDYKGYVINSYALPLIENSRVIHLIDVMQVLFLRLKNLYSQHLNKQLSIEIIVSGIESSEDDLLEALYYLSELHDIWTGRSIGFPYADDNYLCISESVLKYEDIGHILSKHYEWHYINPIKQLTINDYMVGDNSASSRISFLSHTNTTNAPAWYEKLDDTKKALIQEIDYAVINSLSALPTIGLRTIVETVMVEKVGDVEGGFEGKVKCFLEKGYVTRQQADMLRNVLDAGNAAAHRAYFPSSEDLDACIHMVKHLLESVYVIQPKIEKAATNTPKRPKK